MKRLVASPNKPRPTGLTLEIADMLAAIERNYNGEGSGPGTRFEGRLLEDVQAEGVLRRIRQLAERYDAQYVFRIAVPDNERRPFADLLGKEDTNG